MNTMIKFLAGNIPRVCVIFIAIIVLFSPLITLGEECFKIPGEGTRCPPSTATGFLQKIKEVGDLMFTILLALAVLFIVVAGYTYITAAGNEEKVRKAHRMVVYALVAVVIGVVSTGLVRAVLYFFTDPGV